MKLSLGVVFSSILLLNTVQSSAIAAEVSAGKKPYTGSGFENYALSQPDVSYLVSYVGTERESRINVSGATNQNQKYLKGKSDLFIETQKVGYQVMRAGVAANNMSWVEKGILAIEWGLQPSILGVDGSFPEQREDTVAFRALHPKSIFLASATNVVLLARQADIPNDLKSRAEALVPGILLATREIVDSGDSDGYINKYSNSSQEAFIALFIHQAGMISGDQSLVEKAKVYMEAIYSNMTIDGAFLERGGFDSLYQMNTLELSTAYNATIEPGAWRDTVAGYNIKAANWFLGRVRPDGSIDTTGNTRQEACGATPGDFPKGLDKDNTAIRLLYYAYLSGQIKKIRPIASKIQFAGYTYDHIGHCANKIVD